jgi:hypothetical protein
VRTQEEAVSSNTCIFIREASDSIRLNSCPPDSLVRHGRHFGRTVHLFCSVEQLLSNGVSRLRNVNNVEDQNDIDIPTEFVTSFSLPVFHKLKLYREQQEHRVFCSLVRIIPGFQERLLNSSSEEVAQIAALARPILSISPPIAHPLAADPEGLI